MSSASSSSDARPPLKIPRIENRYDVFISHAGPDKHIMAIPLREKLRKHGISSFVDETDMPPGCESVSAMERAMETAAIGVFILSPEFVARKWPVRELYCFLERVEKAALQSRQKPVLIPVFYRLSVSQCHEIRSLLSIHVDGRSPFVDGRFMERQGDGEPEADLGKLQLAFASLVKHMGIENPDDEIVIDSNSRMSSRERLVDKVVPSVKKALKKNEMEGTRGYASQSAPRAGTGTIDSFTARFDVPVPLPHMVMNWECNSDGVAVTMEGKLKKAIMESTQDRDASVVAAVDCSPIGVCGHGGVGKTSALIGVGGEKDVQEHFRDGVYFVTVGGDATDGSMVEALALLVRECGGVKTCSRILVSESVGGAVQMTGGYFRGKRALFMFDDLWPTEKSDVGYAKEVRQLVTSCPQSRILISTRSKDVAGVGRRQVDFGLRDAEGGVARDMLCCSAEIEMDEMLEYEKELGIVLRFCMGLPLTLQVAGCAIRELRDDGVPLCGAIESYVHDLQAEITRLVTERSKEYPSFHHTVVVSLRMADKWLQRQASHRVEKRRTMSELYERLAVLRRQMHAPRSMFRVLWGLDTERETDVVLKKLRDLNLVKWRMKGGEVGVEVHDLLLEFCEVTAGEKVTGYHSDVLSGYYKLRGEDTARSERSGSEIRSGEGTDVEAGVRCWWEDGLSRGYIGENVCRHLAGAGKCEELALLLTDARWALAQVRRGRVMGWMGDFDELFGAMRKWKTGGADVSDLEKGRKGLELVRDGVRESWGYVKRNEREFGWQVYGRLVDQERRGWAVRRLLETTSRYAEKPWLRPKSRCFAVPGGNSVAFPFGDIVTGVAFMDKKAVVSAGKEVFIVDLESGERKIVGERDGLRRAVGVTDIRSDEEIGKVSPCLECISSTAVGGDGRRIMCGYDDGTVRVWDAESGECVGEPLRGHTGWADCLTMSRDGRYIVSGSSDKALMIWDAVSGECVGEPLRGNTGKVECVEMSGDGRRIVSGSRDGTLRVWDVGSGECVGEPLRGHTDKVTCVAVSSDGGRIVSGSSDRTLRLWDVASGEWAGKPLRGHTGWVWCVTMSSDGRRVVSGSSDGTLSVWETGSGECVGKLLRGHTGGVRCVALSSERIVSGSYDQTLRVWDVGSREYACEVLRDETDEADFVAMNWNGRRIVSGSRGGPLRVWDAGSETCVGEPLRVHTHELECVAMSWDGGRIVSGSEEGTLRVWDAGSRECVGKLLRGHTGAVKCVAMSADGRHIVSWSLDKTLRVWDAWSGECVVELLRGHTDAVRCVAVSADGRRIVSGSWDGTLRVWDTDSETCVGELLRGHTDAVSCVAMSWDGQRIVSGSDDKTLRVWDADGKTCVCKTLCGHTDWVTCVAMSSDGRRIVSGSVNGSLRVWDADSETCVGEPLRGHTDWVIFVALSSDGRRVVSGSLDKSLRVWDVGSRDCVGEPLRGHIDAVRIVAGSGDGRRVVSGASDRTLRVWDAESGERVGEPLRGHTLTCVAMSRDGRRTVSGSEEGTLRVWDARSKDCVGELLPGHTRQVTCVTMSGDGRRVVSGSWDKTVRVWDSGIGECVGEPLRGHTQEVTCVTMSEDGRRIVSGSTDRTLRVWDAESGECVGKLLRGHTDAVSCVAMSGDGRRIASGSQDETLRVWDANSETFVGEPLRGHTETVVCVAMSNDGRRVVSGSWDKTVRVWDAGSGGYVGEPLGDHRGAVLCVMLRGDGRRILSGAVDGTLRVWDLGSRECVGEPLRGHTSEVTCVTMSGNGRRIVSGARDGRLRVWDMGSGECVGELLRGHIDAASCVAMSGDGRRVVSVWAYGTLRVWDVETGECVGEPLRGHTREVTCVMMSADGRRIVSGSDDKTLRVWDMLSGEYVGKLLRSHTAKVTCVTMSADGQRIVSGSKDRTLRVWDTNSGESVGVTRQHNGVVERIIMTGTTVLAIGDFGPVKWTLDESDGLVKVQGEGEKELTNVWCSDRSAIVKMSYQGEELLLATLPAEVSSRAWHFDVRHKILVTGFDDGLVVCTELVL